MDAELETNLLSKSFRERGASMVEYALLLALIGIVALSALSALGGSVDAIFDEINDEMMAPCDVWEQDWDELIDRRTALRNTGEWYGADNRPTRRAWVVDRDVINAQLPVLGC